jgi:hypothetical protein
MRPEHLKLAGIVTMVCGAMSPMVAGATNSDSSATSTGQIIPLRSVTPDAAPTGIEDDARDGTAAPQGSAPEVEVAQTNDADTSPVVASMSEPQAVPTTNAAADDVQASNAPAKTEDSDREWSSPDLVAVSDSRLDNMRGGFDLPSGLVVSFGISREAFVNGIPVASTSFNIPNIAQMTPQQAQMVASANNGVLIQNGLNNTVQPGGLPALTGAVIQNTLSNQQIQALTTINTSVNSLSTFQAMNLGATLNNALLNVVRPR